MAWECTLLRLCVVVVLSPSYLLASESSNGKLCHGLKDALKGCWGGGAREAGGEEELWRQETAPTMAESDMFTDLLISVIFYIYLCFQLLL